MTIKLALRDNKLEVKFAGTCWVKIGVYLGRAQMKTNKIIRAMVIILAIILTLAITACQSSPTSPSPKPGGGALVNSDSIVTAKIQALYKQTSGYPWALEVLIEYTVDVDSLVNPTKDSVGKVITVKTDQDMTTYEIGEVVTARVKYTGDVNTPGGVTLYIYSIAPEIHP